MKRILIYFAIAFLVYYVLKVYFFDRQKYLSYLKEVGLPENILSQMTFSELKASARYLKRYAKTGKHFTIDDKDYNILSSIRNKYGIFT